ncbi:MULTISPECIES: hypothetical protein [unclassified Colwellia]|jgi:hypothetical protein|uniref:hypothetical protein n=1 Tax=unclassified Colwellia TaxID=196834 RepID=UPI0015F6ABA7|nr:MULTISPECIES: hypothetical protein [unclassified Colwellia]MBA6233619.1 hypothetical protein [Colwellia sp. MB02u-7]MBA6238179.1 hypothetical protein [Colwellia sp. MB02u-11]MBA6255057.1 hypothetical protein [Colwellia sp. MB3u-28]MBA6258992.1 hypothetical protein [Colwellia sp. MB3u-41]MBA6299684.1 hypothetical protein [Colwellia sp. MB3u-22]
METKLDVNSIKLTSKYINNAVADQSIQFNKNLLRKLSEKALNRAFELDRART